LTIQFIFIVSWRIEYFWIEQIILWFLSLL
jgi:hypothetical protein